MSLIQVQNLSFACNGSLAPVFDADNRQIDTNWKLGLIRCNGSGKTTFLRLLRDARKPVPLENPSTSTPCPSSGSARMGQHFFRNVAAMQACVSRIACSVIIRPQRQMNCPESVHEVMHVPAADGRSFQCQSLQAVQRSGSPRQPDRHRPHTGYQPQHQPGQTERAQLRPRFWRTCQKSAEPALHRI